MRGVANGTVSAYAYCPPRRHHHRPVPRPRRHPARLRRSTSASPTVRTSRCATSPKPTLRALYDRLDRASAWPRPAPSSRATSSSCPGADTCNLAVTQSRGLAADIGDALEEAGLAEVPRRAHQHLRLHELLRPAPHLRHRLLRARAPRARARRARLPDAARRSPRRHARSSSARRPRSCRPRRRPKRSCGSSRRFDERARARARRSRRGSPARAAPRRVGDDARRPRPLPHARRRPRVLRRLRRDRSLRRRGRRRGVRDMTSTPIARRTLDAQIVDRPLVDVDLGELAAVSAELERKPASAAIKWAWERFGTGVVLAASFQDCVLIDVAVQAVPEHRGRVPRHAVPLRGDALVRRAGARALRPQPHGHAAARSRPTTSGRPTPTSAARCARSSRSPARSRASRRG